MHLKWILLGLLAVAAGAHAQDTGPSPDEQSKAEQAARAMVADFSWKDGEVAVDTAKARLRLDENFRYLAAADARKVLENLWGNPPDDSVLGLIVPKGRGVLDDAGWAVVVTYSDEGHVSDEDAAKIDYDEMLADMKAEDEEINQARKEAGYGTLNLVGWAEAPHYDTVSKKLYWAKELKSEGAEQNTLNYDIRVLGREGYLSLNAVSRMNELGEVKTGMQKLLPMVEFDSGARYADFNDSTDKVAAYGLAALVGGGLAAKSGLLAKLGVLLLGLKKLLIPLLLVVGAFFKRIVGVFRGKRGDDAQA
ncbi:DUF2167 domain-containing protein [Agrilutibacter solisilvae]|uniref:DUF2167 domain-containing protein n=1 Tax=Agrilutibacter solisilvae TaxID=2763317 RepID=A0A975ASQ7_9GAMM|nr:DUF2167 domain-containing protein [Lysobacter solisilvae]QSX79204.1 DUF2167 domain-containing protein [Lysobacter solisilvae]